MRFAALAAPLLALTLFACGAKQPPARAKSAHASVGQEAPPAALPPPPVPEITRDQPAREFVPRDVIEEVLAAGMGHLLRRVQVEPAREDGRFIGYRVVALDPTWEGGPVQVDDVVVRLNGMTLQTPDAAQRALGTLTVASELVLEVRRDGEPTRTHLAIR